MKSAQAAVTDIDEFKHFVIQPGTHININSRPFGGRALSQQKCGYDA
jgi:hypothetical protein